MEDGDLQYQHANLSISDVAVSGVRSQFANRQTLKNSHQLVLRGHRPLAVPFSPKLPSDSDDVDDVAIEERHLQVPSPTEVLDASEVDPFATVPVDLPPSMLSELMDQTRTILLRQVTNRYAQDRVASNVAGQMLQMTVQNKALFYSMIAAAMRFARIARNDIVVPPAELLVEARSIELLSQRMAHLDTALTETNIVAIIACGYCGKVYSMRRGRLPRQSFLKELQDLNIYGRMVVVDAHVLGLMKLVPMMGGLYNLKTPGLAQLISFCDLFDCTRKLQSPLVPFVPYSQDFEQRGQHTDHDHGQFLPSPKLAVLGKGFPVAWRLTDSRHVLNLFNVLSELAAFTILMDNFIEGRCTLSGAVELTDHRNNCHHGLMSLPTMKSLKAAVAVEVDIQYESCRLACIAYNLLVIFPLPPTVGLFEKLVKRLQFEIRSLSYAHDAFDTGRRKMHFWILTMSAIASVGLPERQYFLAELLIHAERLKIASWQEAAEVLATFLWHPTTNSKDGLDVWTEIHG